MRGPVLGAHTFGFVWDRPAEAAFEAIAAAGFQSIQLMAAPPHFNPWSEDAARNRALRRLCETHGLPILALDLASSDINLASASPDVTTFAVDAYERLVLRAAELGAPAICIGSGRRHALLSSANDRLMETFRPAFARIHSFAARHGIRLSLENHPQGLLASARQMRAFLEHQGYGDVTVIYDVANAFAIDEDPVEGLVHLGDRTEIIHLSDAPKGAWKHDPIGSGDIDFMQIGQHLRASGFSRHIVLEILSDDPLGGLTEGVARLLHGQWTLPRLNPRNIQKIQ